MADKPLFESYLSAPEQRGSECAFSNLFVWRDCYNIFWCVSHGFLIVKVKRNDVDFFLQPFGGSDEDLPKLMEELKEYHGGKPFRLHGIYECTKERLSRVFPDLEFEEDRDNWDYVYLREKLAALSVANTTVKKITTMLLKRHTLSLYMNPLPKRIRQSALLLVKNGVTIEFTKILP